MTLASLFGLLMAASVDDDSTIKYFCDDIVVIARIENGEYHLIEDEEDLLGHGIVDARAHVRRVIQGSPPFHIDFRYFTHASYIESEDFLMVLQPLDGGKMWLRSATLVDDRFFIDDTQPVLAGRCARAKTVTE